MEEKLHKTRTIFDDFNIVLINQDTLSYSLKAYFTEYILIVMCAELEKKLLMIIGGFFKLHSNDILSYFLTNSCAKIFSKVNINDIKNTLKILGKDKKFDKNLLPEEIKTYENFIDNRNAVAHGGQSINISWEEISITIATIEKIINILKQSLNAE